MVSLRSLKFLISLSLLSLSACQLGYIAESAFYQAKLLRQRVPLTYALENYQLSQEQREKIELAIVVRKFMKEELGLKADENYSRYVHLDRDYVTYAVNASPKNKLETYRWHFPIVGSVPYKGYFKKQSALEEAEKLKKKNLDTYVRGVSAFSTLGWFEDPLLSSMLRMKEHQFVNTLIHETVHANLYIKGESKFNERIASFLGQLGAEAFYAKQNRSQELKKIVDAETKDELLFSEFISSELKKLREWYKENGKAPDLEEKRKSQFENIRKSFVKNLKPKLQTKNYLWLETRKLNNAFLLLLELYNSDFSVLEKIANHNERDFKKMFSLLKTLESVDQPEDRLEEMAEKI